MTPAAPAAMFGRIVQRECKARPRSCAIDVLGGPVIVMLAILAFLAGYIIPRIG